MDNLGLYGTIDWLVAKVKKLCCIVENLQNQQQLYYGSYFSTQDQINTEGGVLAMTVNNTDFQNGISISGTGSEIVIANAGKYNIQFSAQLHHRSGGGSGKHVDIWFAKNGVMIADSNTRVDVDTNTPYQVAAWNYFVDAVAGDKYEIMWTTANASIVIEQEPANATHPATPSVIITVNRIG